MSEPALNEPAVRDGLRHLHPLTPFLRGWAALAALAAFFGRDVLRDLELRELALGLAVVVPVVLGYGYLAWRATRYGIVDGDLRHEQGIVFRRSRRVRLDRLQSVDVVRPLVARALGLAELRLEVAGGSSPEAPLAYLSDGDARSLRAELLARAAGLHEQTPEAPERVLHKVPPVRLALSELLAVGTIVGIAGTGAMIGWVAATGSMRPLFVVGPLLIGLVMPPVRRFAVHFEFTLAESPDGLRIRQGLLETRAQTVPPGRVQAVRLVRPPLWRLFGDWARIEVNVAGYGGQSDNGATTAVLLPVAPMAEAAALLGQVFPGVRLDEVVLRGVPRRARLVDPLVWRRLAVGADGSVFVARRGLLRQETDVMPHDKPQSFRLTQGPLQRRQRLTTLHLDTTPGPVRVHAAHRDADEALVLLLDQVERSRRARVATAGRERWMAQAPPSDPQDV